MTESNETLLINAQIEIPVAAIQAVVENAKKAVGPDASGVYHVDTAEALNRIITRFLSEKGFAEYAANPSNYVD